MVLHLLYFPFNFFDYFATALERLLAPLFNFKPLPGRLLLQLVLLREVLGAEAEEPLLQFVELALMLERGLFLGGFERLNLLVEGLRESFLVLAELFNFELGQALAFKQSLFEQV